MQVPHTIPDPGSSFETVERRPRDGAATLRRLFRATLLDEIERRNGGPAKRVFKAGSGLRRLITGTVAGDPASIAALLVVAEAAGGFDQPYTEATKAAVLLRWLGEPTPSSRAGRG